MTDVERDDPTYPHLESLERVLVDYPDYLTQPVTVTEKIHGFSARIGRDSENRLWVGTRKLSYLVDDAPSLQGLTDWARGVPTSAVGLGVTIYGEWAGRGVQKGIDYGEKRFYAFGERLGAGPVLSSVSVLDSIWSRGITAVPMIGEGVSSFEFLQELRMAGSVAAEGQQLEGLVVAPVVPYYDRYGRQLIAKFKHPAFAERASARDERERPDTSTVDALAAEFVVAERMRHVLDQAYEILFKAHGLMADPLDVRHTGLVLRTMYEDVVREAAAEVEALSDADRKLLGKAINRVAKALLDEARLEAARAVAP